MLIFAVMLISLKVRDIVGDSDSRRLYDDLLMKKYNRLVRPVINSSFAVDVDFGLKLAQLINVDEKNEIMTTYMWVIQEWTDYKLKWNPENYGGVNVLYVPLDEVWLPDIVLCNSADGNYAMTATGSTAMLTNDGKVRWTPPAIFNSICDIDVEYFPFDQQICKLKFMPWSHDGFAVDMQHIWKVDNSSFVEVGIDMTDFVPSHEWDVLAVPANKNYEFYPCCPKPFLDITFNITLRRKTLFYTFNIIIPCVCINLLILTCFYVPCDCSEKISICITILLSLSMFQLMLMDLVPSTSLTIPLLGKYILFTLAVLCGSIICSVISLNVHYRGNKVGLMSDFTKWFFLDMLAKIMCIQLPRPDEIDQLMHQHWSPPIRHSASISRPSISNFFNKKAFVKAAMQRYTAANVDEAYPGFSISPTFLDDLNTCDQCRACEHPSLDKACDGITFIARHHIDKYFAKQMKHDWICMAMVVDRFLLWLYVTLTSVCSMLLLLNAPALFDTRIGFGIQ